MVVPGGSVTLALGLENTQGNMFSVEKGVQNTPEAPILAEGIYTRILVWKENDPKDHLGNVRALVSNL